MPATESVPQLAAAAAAAGRGRPFRKRKKKKAKLLPLKARLKGYEVRQRKEATLDSSSISRV